MWSSSVVLLSLFIFFPLNIETLSCYQCSMKYSNEECNANNSTVAIECQPTFDTCLTIVLKPAILDQLLITKYCTKRKSCEHQRNYTHSLTPCRPNNEGRSWGCVSCCGDRDLCNYDHSSDLKSNRSVICLMILSLILNFYFMEK